WLCVCVCVRCTTHIFSLFRRANRRAERTEDTRGQLTFQTHTHTHTHPYTHTHTPTDVFFTLECKLKAAVYSVSYSMPVVCLRERHDGVCVCVCVSQRKRGWSVCVC